VQIKRIFLDIFLCILQALLDGFSFMAIHLLGSFFLSVVSWILKISAMTLSGLPVSAQVITLITKLRVSNLL